MAPVFFEKIAEVRVMDKISSTAEMKRSRRKAKGKSSGLLARPFLLRVLGTFVAEQIFAFRVSAVHTRFLSVNPQAGAVT